MGECFPIDTSELFIYFYCIKSDYVGTLVCKLTYPSINSLNKYICTIKYTLYFA